MGPTAGGPDRTIPANWDRQPAARIYTDPLFKNKNKILFVMISMVVLQIESTIKTLQYVHLGFSVGQGHREIIFRM